MTGCALFRFMTACCGAVSHKNITSDNHTPHIFFIVVLKLFLFVFLKGERDGLTEVRRNGTVHRKMSLPVHLSSSPGGFSSFLLFKEVQMCLNEVLPLL